MIEVRDLSGNSPYVPPRGHILSPNGARLAVSFTATGVSASIPITGRFTVNAAGGFGGGTLSIQRSLDFGASWDIISRDFLGAAASYTAPFGFVGLEASNQALYRFNLTGAAGATLSAVLEKSPPDRFGNNM